MPHALEEGCVAQACTTYLTGGKNSHWIGKRSPAEKHLELNTGRDVAKGKRMIVGNRKPGGITNAEGKTLTQLASYTANPIKKGLLGYTKRREQYKSS